MPGQQGRFGAFLTGRDRGYLVESGRVAEWQQNRRGTSYHTGIVQVFIYLGWLSTRRRSGGLEVPRTSYVPLSSQTSQMHVSALAVMR